MYASQMQVLINRIVDTLFEFITIILDYLYPKDSKIIVFGSGAGRYFLGDPKSLSEYIKENDSKYGLYFYMLWESFQELNKRYFISFAPIFLKARFLVSSNPNDDFFPFVWSSRKMLINTWHGTPLKRDFFTAPYATKKALVRMLRVSKKTSVCLVSSKLEATLLERSLHIDSGKFYYLGHPRNDVLLRSNITKRLPDILKDPPEYKTVILYSPTYRPDSRVSFFPFDDLDLQHLDHFLEKNKIIILARSHFFDKGSKQFFSKRIIDFGFEIFNDVNSILPEVDILITDYSSIYIDYLLLNRPCIFIPYDLEDYKKKTGLLLDYESWTAGHKVLTYKQFVDVIEDILSGKDIYKDKREKLRKMYHTFQTENSCERILKLIQNWKKKNNN
jgi:CDP-glycerol glycerophosphotransferase